RKCPADFFSNLGDCAQATSLRPGNRTTILFPLSVLKGGKVKGNKMVVRFPGRNDVAWAQSPKFEKNQRGIFCLNRDHVSGVPTTKLGGNQVNAYTCLGHGAALPMAEEAHVRSLLKSQ